ncbi:MAG: Spy/CpxP family protein refolding chaperone [Pseudomonadota bacterium]
MKRKVYQISIPVKLVVVMVAFLSTIFFVNATLSFAGSGKKKSAEEDRISAVEHTEIRIKELESALKITDAQKELWNTITQVMRENAKDMDTLTKDRAEITKTLNAVEHLKFYHQITQARLDQQKKFLPPFEAFYASMSDEQKKSTDTIFRTGRHGKHKKN